ncbi:MAG: PASTA domain-containing protein [Stellaceae bacterium]
MRAAFASKPYSRAHMPEKGNAERGPVVFGAAGLALIAYLFGPFVLPSDAAGRPSTEAQANNPAAPVDKPREAPSETAASDRRDGRYLLAGLPTVVAPASSGGVPPPSPPAPTNLPAPPVAARVGVPVPPVVGQPGPSAIAALSRAGFKSRRQEEPSDTVPPGRVIGTSPLAGTLVDKGSTVIVTIAAPVGVVVPRVVGQKVGTATAALGRVGLKSQRREQPSARATPGTVISTLPIAGQSVEKGATVTLVIAKAIYRDTATDAALLPPNQTEAVAPRMAVLPPATTSTGSFSPRASTAFGSSSAQAVSPPVPAPAAPSAPTTPPVLSGDALIRHLYDNAHGPAWDRY